MTTKLNIIAFDSDVRCLNANLQHRKAWIVQDFGGRPTSTRSPFGKLT